MNRPSARPFPLSALAATNGGLVSNWITVETLHPESDEAQFRVRCTRPSCTLAKDPTEFMNEDTSLAWAQDHANHCKSDVVVERRA